MWGSKTGYINTSGTVLQRLWLRHCVRLTMCLLLREAILLSQRTREITSDLLCLQDEYPQNQF